MRIQVLHLPASADSHPFALVIDQVSHDQQESLRGSLIGAAETVGARGTLVFEGEVEVL